MNACTKQEALMAPVDVHQLGRASIDANDPQLPEISGKRVAIIGGGPAGISMAWQLRLKGHDAVIFDQREQLGGKVTSAIPNLRVPETVVATELERVRRVLPHVALKQKIRPTEFERLRAEFDFVVVAVGAQKPRSLPVPGAGRAITALDFLSDAKAGKTLPGKRIVIIGAGNVGCDVAAMAHLLGADDITLIDVQQPASFGKEREEAEKAGAVFRWPCLTKEITKEGVVLTDGELLPADTVYISIGDAPELDFLTDDIQTEQGYITVNAFNQTSAPDVFAIGDAIKLGLLTDAIGQGRRAAEAIDDIHNGRRPAGRARRVIDTSRITLEYFDPRISEYTDMQSCSTNCSSCGSCRDCELCVALCPQAAISRQVPEAGGYEYVVNADLCIGCGFCSAVCPCGVWNLVENTPLT
jgi:NADPH-dependent glutamate synthase beta subunit-like oxidoreductase/Pyruvate/2-oxoacid:ferredoxin oxidoreductase delta subunit